MRAPKLTAIKWAGYINSFKYEWMRVLGVKSRTAWHKNSHLFTSRPLLYEQDCIFIALTTFSQAQGNPRIPGECSLATVSFSYLDKFGGKGWGISILLGTECQSVHIIIWKLVSSRPGPISILTGKTSTQMAVWRPHKPRWSPGCPPVAWSVMSADGSLVPPTFAVIRPPSSQYCIPVELTISKRYPVCSMTPFRF